MTGVSRKVELNLDGTWTDISAYVLERDPIRVARGRQDEQSEGETGTCTFTLDNRDGRFSPRNPTGAYYGTIGRNTPVRVSTLLGGVRLVKPDGLIASCPDTAANSITGDIDVRVDAVFASWVGSGSNGNYLLSKGTAAPQISWQLRTTSTGALGFEWTTDGTTTVSVTSTVPLPNLTGRMAVRATLDVNNGSGGNTVTFYTSDTISGTWLQLGTAVVTAGVTSIYNSTSTVVTGPSIAGGYYAIKVLENIGGTERVNPDFTAQAEGTTAFTDGAGNNWTMDSGVSVTARRYRFYGEVSDWPVSWDASGGDVATQITANGILRRLGQGSQTVISAIREAVLGASIPAYGYWPMEDGTAATSLGSALPTGQPMEFRAGSVTALADEAPFRVCGAVPKLNGVAFFAPVAPYTFVTRSEVRFLLAVPTSGETDDQVLVQFFCAGSASNWRLLMDTSGTGGLTLQAYNSVGTQLFSSGAGFPTVGKFLLVTIVTEQSGANINWQVVTHATTTGDGLVLNGTLNSNTIGAITMVVLNPNSTLIESHVGHLMVHGAQFVDADDGILGYINETAGDRLSRLSTSAGVAFSPHGDIDETTLMGTQVPATFLQNVADCEVTDAGYVSEARADQSALTYRTRRSMCAQNPAATLDYTDTTVMLPTDDDQYTRNDVTADRPGGSSARRTLTSGALSTQDPPDGVGIYSTTYPVNTNVDTYLPDHANWRLAAGTIDRLRYPTVGVQIGGPGIARTSTLAGQLLDADIGDVLLIENLPAWLPPDDPRLLILGYVESMGFATHDIEYVCAPADLYDTGFYTDPRALPARYDHGGCTLNEALDSTETGVDVITAAGNPVWTQAGGDYPFDLMVGGELMTATAISGAGSTQTFTVTRSVNGVVKSHTSGTPVSLARPFRYHL